MKEIKLILLFILLTFYYPGHTQLKDALKLTISSNGYSDETIVRFLPEATDTFDPDWDAYKLQNGGNTPNLSSVVNQELYTINALHAPFTDKTVELNLEVAFAGTYTITSEEIGLFDSSCAITLTDSLLNIVQDLRTDSIYSFDFSPGDPANRFYITFKSDTSSSNTQTLLTSLQSLLIKQSLSVYIKKGQLVCKLPDAGVPFSIKIYDLYGRELIHFDNQVDFMKCPLGSISYTGGVIIVTAESTRRSFSETTYLPTP